MLQVRPKTVSNSIQINHGLGRVVLFWISVYALAIFQDYVFSRIQSTGFYWPDTLLYNSYWLLFIPAVDVVCQAYKKCHPKLWVGKVLYLLSTGFIFSLLHIFLFTAIFILLSNVFFSPPHRFSMILKSAISNQWHITILFYAFMPLVYGYLKGGESGEKQIQTKPFARHITVKQGTKRVHIHVDTIESISTDKPYTAIISKNHKFLHSETLKKLEKRLDPDIFLRVHRSTIVNSLQIIELRSRKNGDYDALFANGRSVRLSRHYRKNWSVLINH